MPDTSTPTAPAEEMVRVYNKFTSRTLIHTPYRSAPASFATVPASVAKLWMERFPDDIVDAGVAQKEMNGVAAELAETRTKLAASEARVKVLEAQLEKKGLKPTSVI